MNIYVFLHYMFVFVNRKDTRKTYKQMLSSTKFCSRLWQTSKKPIQSHQASSPTSADGK